MANDDDDDPTQVDGRKKKAPATDDDDDEATKHTGPPKRAVATKKILEESRRMNAALPKKEAKKLHPLVPLGVAFAILAVVLLVINALTSSPSTGTQGEDKPGAVKKLFDW